MPQPAGPMRTERYETIIIGGGPAGLAVAHELLRRDVDCLVLDAAPAHLPHKDEVATYLEAYASRFDLLVRRGTAVRSLSRRDGHYELLTDDLRYEATNVVVTTGDCEAPSIPSFAGELSLEITSLHRDGVAVGEPGLYLLDQHFHCAHISAQLGDVRRDAARIAERIGGPVR